MENPEGTMRLNRAIAASGYCSRRKADTLIAEGRVSVNGVITTEFNRLVVPEEDELRIDDRRLDNKKKLYLAFNKPKDVLTTCEDERGRKTILDLLPSELSHLKPVGRLDRDTEGLLILTNDGEIAFQLAHPSFEVWKTYHVLCEGKINEASLKLLRNGVELNDGMTRPARVHTLRTSKNETTLEISISEGRNRQIRRMCSQIGHPVRRLVRVAIGGLQLESLRTGQWRRLTRQEIKTLCLSWGKE